LTLVGSNNADAAATNGVQLTLGGAVINFANVEQQAFDLSSGNNSLTVNAGTLEFDQDAGGNTLLINQQNELDVGSLNLTVNSPGAVIFNASQDLASLVINNGATAIMAADGTRVLQTQSLVINGAGSLDIGNNRIVVANISSSTLRGYLVSGRNGGAWNGQGINSSAASASAGSRTIGYVLNGAVATIAYAAPGDTDLNGQVNSADIQAILASTTFNNGKPATWAQGDFNYDGFTTSEDIQAALASNVFNQGTYSIQSNAKSVNMASRLSRTNLLITPTPSDEVIPVLKPIIIQAKPPIR
jgi:hypothetical protein